MTGKSRDADSLFKAILSSDPMFSLDPIRTSPKIYEVYFAAKSEWQKGQPIPPPAVATPPPAPLPPLPRPPAYRYGLYLCPFAAGQFYNQERAKGALFLALQAVSLTAVLVLYQKRQDLYNPEYGWYGGNLEENRNCVLGMRAGFSLAAVAYLYSAADAFITDRRKGQR